MTWLDARRQAVAQVRLELSAVAHEGWPAVLGLVVDETTERLMQAELRQNEARLDAVLEATSDGLLVLGHTPVGGVVRMTNRAFLEQFDLTVGTVLGIGRGPPSPAARAREGAQDVAAFLASTGSERRVEAVALDGRRPRVLELESMLPARPGGLADGPRAGDAGPHRPEGFETRLQLNAEELRRSQDALEEAYRSLNVVNQDLESRTRQLDSLAGEREAEHD